MQCHGNFHVLCTLLSLTDKRYTSWIKGPSKDIAMPQICDPLKTTLKMNISAKLENTRLR